MNGDYSPVQEGFVKVFQCLRNCGKCHLIDRFRKDYGRCETVPNCPGLWRMYECVWERDWVVRSYFSNPACIGRPNYRDMIGNRCYPNPYRWGNGGVNQISGDQCGYDGDMDERVEPRTWLRYECELVPPHWGELREDNVHLNINAGNAVILVAVLSIVCLIGFIAGYLIYRKRNKIAEKDNFYAIQRKQTNSVVNSL